jgi:hypothetical protein
VLLGAAGVLGSAALLNACAGSSTAGSSTGGSGTAADAFVLVQRYPNTSLTPGNVRLAVSIASTAGAIATTGPDRLTGSILDSTGATVASIDAPRFGAGQAVPYWSITASIATAGIYYLKVDGATGDPTPFQLFDPSKITIPAVGSTLPGFDTPTVADARGVDPICTRSDGACPFHDVTLTEALSTAAATAGTPHPEHVVYMIGTPAHCQTGTCAPGLESLIEVSKPYRDAGVTFVHAEVYADPKGTVVAPAVEDLTLDYEPVIWVTDAKGVVVTRIDIVWDAAELQTLLAAALA